MKTTFYIIVFVLSTIFTSCSNNDSLELFNIATPEYMSKEDFRSSVKITSPRDIVESGKIYTYEDFVLVNDVNKGIHIIDNSNPVNPSKKAFIEILANKDMEVRGDFLYADSLMDVVVFNISDLNNITEVSRVKDVFPGFLPFPDLENVEVNYESYNYDEDKILVSWDIKQEYREVELEPEIFIDVAFSSDDAVSGGEGGSLARFKIIDDYLYAVDNNYINVFDISDLESPVVLNDVYAGFGIETIFNRDNYLFLGSTNGMFIDSSLEIIDIRDIQNPSLVKTYTLDNPYGLGFKDDLLFICDGTSGLKVYNKENVEDLKLLESYSNITAYDVVPLKSRLMMIGEGVLYQYNYVNNGLNLISEFSLK